MKFWRRIPMRYKMIIGLALLVGILFLWGRNLQAQVHVSDKKYDIMLSTLLSPGVPAVSVDSIEHGKYLLLDAREKREFEVSHIENAMWVGYDDFDLKRVAGISKEEYLAVYCSVGYRSERITEKLREAGYLHVYNVYGGIFEWVNTGHPVVTDLDTPTEEVHAYSSSWGVWLKQGRKVYE
ncbi:MAG TPA: rhodanese-like domain-containing protein [Chitinophagales bacterium]|nr:rhodanese-like domain-containing protein [Chitinophagales bacterium]HQU39831.1 rhodanese-like domain-containing protein [Chitinophagales bacterium]HRX24473.1 rhodanese-like domain-containing protein [Chitinophagales bacterium]